MPQGFFIPAQLNDLAVDVLVDTPADGEVLTYDDGTSKWVNADPATLVDIPAALDDLSDVAITTPSDDQFLRHNGSGWVNESVNLKRSVVVVLMAGHTPEGTGADAYEAVMPYSPVDGTTSITWTLRRIDFRVSTAGGAPAFKLQKSTDAGAFSATDMDTVTMGSGDSEVATTSGFDNASAASGNKLRVEVTDLGTAEGWSISALFEASA